MSSGISMGQQRCLDSNCFGSFQPQNSNGLTFLCWSISRNETAECFPESLSDTQGYSGEKAGPAEETQESHLGDLGLVNLSHWREIEECYIHHLEFLEVKEDVNPTNSNK